jgi:hypothetical protein
VSGKGPAKSFPSGCTRVSQDLFDPKSVAAAQDHRSFNNVLQLADISRLATDRHTIGAAPVYCCHFANLLASFLCSIVERDPVNVTLSKRRFALSTPATRADEPSGAALN